MRWALALLLLAGCATLGVPDAQVVQPGGYRLAVRGAPSLAFADARRAVEADLEDFAARGFPRTAVDDGAFALEQALAARGHPFASVEWSLQPGADGVADIAYDVDEGPRVELSGVRFEGNAALSDDELRPLFLAGDGAYVESRVASAVAAAAALYLGQGFLQAQVGPARVSFSADRAEAQVVVPIVEGGRQHVARIVVRGDTDVPAAELERSVAEFAGRPYFPQVAFAVRTRLLERLGAAGHPDAVATFTEHAQDGAVELDFDVRAGPRVGIAGVDVTGVQRTDPDFVRARLALQPGSTWTTDAQRESYAKLDKSGLFDDVRLALAAAPDAPPDAVPPGTEPRTLQVSVTESSSREVFIEPGYGSYEGPRVVAGYRDRNVAGEGLTFHSEAALSGKVHRALVGLTDPWLFPSLDVSGDVSLFAGLREEPSFTRHEIGTALTFGHEFDARDSGFLVYSLKRTSVSSVQVVDPTVLDAESSVDVGSLALTGVHDSRDDLFAPTRGLLARVTGEVASTSLGGEIDFLRARIETSWFSPFPDGTVIAASFRTGVISPRDGTDEIPLQERFFNGGQDSVRSFREDELGPTDANGHQIGGETFSVLSFEWRHPLRGQLGGALFLDAGNVESDAAKYFGFHDIEYAVGAGLRYQLPVGPVRLDVGWNPYRQPGEDSYVVHLSVGMPF